MLLGDGCFVLAIYYLIAPFAPLFRCDVDPFQQHRPVLALIYQHTFSDMSACGAAQAPTAALTSHSQGILSSAGGRGAPPTRGALAGGSANTPVAAEEESDEGGELVAIDDVDPTAANSVC